MGTGNKKIKGTIVVGYDNGSQSYGYIGSSYKNMVIGYNAKSACREGIVLGNDLAGNGYAIGTTILGICNKKDSSDRGQTERISANSSAVIVGAGISNNRLNAVEIDNTGLVAIPHGLCLDSINTTVNAITPAKNSPASADDTTLVTKSYITSQSINYEPSSEIQLNAVTTYSLGNLIGDPNWSFPYSSGSITLVFSVDQVFHTVHIPIPSYFNTSIHPIIKAPLTDIHNYQITNPGDSGTLKGLLLFYKPSTKEISLENPECVNIDNVGDSIRDAFNYGNPDIWFWGMTCYNHF